MVLWGANFAIAGLLLFQRFENPAFAWSLRLGLILTIIGMGLGYLMTSPTAQQLANWETGAAVTVVGAHTVGVADGGPGLPVVGWSTQGGDLRIPHFVGMHALQVVPFLGWWISRRKRLTPSQQTALVWSASGFYLGVVALLAGQALRAQPLLHPDTLTIALFVGLSAASGIAAWLSVRLSRAQGSSFGSPPAHV